MEFSRQEYWKGLPFPSPGDLPDPGLNTGLLHCRQKLYRLSRLGSPLFCLSVCSYPDPLVTPPPAPTGALGLHLSCLGSLSLSCEKGQIRIQLEVKKDEPERHKKGTNFLEKIASSQENGYDRHFNN